MKSKEAEFFGVGYDECLLVIRTRLEDVLKQKGNTRVALTAFLDQLAQEAEETQWNRIQDEFPGITREEYAEELESSKQEIRRTFYSEAGFRKPRLVRST